MTFVPAELGLSGADFASRCSYGLFTASRIIVSDVFIARWRLFAERECDSFAEATWLTSPPTQFGSGISFSLMISPVSKPRLSPTDLRMLTALFAHRSCFKVRRLLSRRVQTRAGRKEVADLTSLQNCLTLRSVLSSPVSSTPTTPCESQLKPPPFSRPLSAKTTAV